MQVVLIRIHMQHDETLTLFKLEFFPSSLQRVEVNLPKKQGFNYQ